MQKFTPTFLSSKVSVIGIFASLILVLSIPVLVLISQQRQDQRSRASEISPTPQAPTTGSRVVSGYVYHDDNKDGEREPGEQAFSGATIRIKQIKDPGVVGDQGQIATTSDIKTDTNGYFRYRFPASQNDSTSYSVKVVLPDKYKTITTNPVIITDIEHNLQDIIEFGLFPIDALPDTAPVVTISPTPIKSGKTIQQNTTQSRQTPIQSGRPTSAPRTMQMPAVQGQ